MTKLRWPLVAAVVFTNLTGSALAIELGDPAPPLKIKEWVKGKPVDFEAGKDKNVYVLEFWATWCAPCWESARHLTAVQKKFKDRGVVIVGISDEPVDKIKPYVEKIGDKMGYIVAADDGKATYKTYMTGFNIESIPTAFVIDKSGTIVWQGHPMSNLERVLEEVLTGTYDIVVAQQAEKARRLIPDYFKLAVEGKDAKKAGNLGSKIVKLGALNAGLMNELAWRILTQPGIDNRDLDLAMKAAKAAYDGCEGKDAAIVDTYARALFDTGKKAEAIEYQKKAIKMSENEQMRKALKETLDGYEQEAAKGDR